MDPIIIRLGGKPQSKVKHTGVSKGGKAFVSTPAKTANYMAALRHAATETMDGRPPLDGPLSVAITATFPIPKGWPKWRRNFVMNGGIEYYPSRPDSDNLVKALDAFNELVWRDDAQVALTTVRKVYGDVPGFWVRVSCLPVAEQPPLKTPAMAAADLLERRTFVKGMYDV